ncbi:GNAT family N-acetyltransferase [Stackebrandtia nassauensis]|uniref:GCN5-related N-acetyltransferase n=1 Tax=Stackebrandtia nassauensis (strain DSM 44728 / CIP 108903 / NRRL B-16338 / NBRC 102104 / LLR-40K-21) TaxID=446470 RepID=D3Q5F0_STANL|nr:GNAT family N-acetyltransferase [Stackebrandtia nassauensis]ADD46010.1 GCN5-related N-acetyltransferase [Stackebrandtia nassauensis DSM 44728]
MTDVTIRPADPDRDAAAIAALSTREFDFLLHNAATMRRNLDDSNPRKRKLSLVAEKDGELVAYAITSLDLESSVEGAATVNLIVAPEHRRTGIASALIEPLSAHWEAIGASTVTARLISEEAAAFAEKRGFKRSRTERISHVSLAGIPDVVAPAEGIVLKPLSELDDDRALYALDCAAMVDVPADEPWVPLPFDEWVEQYMADPRLDRHNTVLAFDGDTAVSVAWVERVGTRMWSGLTATLREYRGRGLAKAAKSAALHRARADGVVDAYTNNDATNAGMLAVNTWLGYRLHTEQYTHVHTR